METQRPSDLFPSEQETSRETTTREGPWTSLDEVPASESNDGEGRNQLKVTSVQGCHRITKMQRGDTNQEVW